MKTLFLKENVGDKRPELFFITCVLCSICLSHAFSSIAVVLLAVVSLVIFKRKFFRFEINLLLPVALFLLMALSLFWTSDNQASVKAIQKSIPLFIIPICFLFFRPFTKAQQRKILKYFSFSILAFTIFWLLKALFRFINTKDTGVFFYHELVTEELNAIHVSVYVSVACFYFLTQSIKSNLDRAAIILLSFFLILLSSKNIIIIFLTISVIYFFKIYKRKSKTRLLKWVLLSFIIGLAVFFGRIKSRFLVEYQSITSSRTLNYDIGTETEKVYNVSIGEAWNNKSFQQSDFFPGTAFRVYQIRIFKEMLQEDQVFFTGYGLNATDHKIQEKAIHYGLYKGYDEKNFHNEYIQIFAELGIFGFLILVAILTINIKNAIKTKDFIHISFAILMISLFLTESFLSRQRGIIFFTTMYCLFNSGNVLMLQTNKKNI